MTGQFTSPVHRNTNAPFNRPLTDAAAMMRELPNWVDALSRISWAPVMVAELLLEGEVVLLRVLLVLDTE